MGWPDHLAVKATLTSSAAKFSAPALMDQQIKQGSKIKVENRTKEIETGKYQTDKPMWKKTNWRKQCAGEAD